MNRVAAAAFTALALLCGAGASSAATPCSNDTFAIDGSSVSVQICVAQPAAPTAAKRGAAAKSSPVSLEETLAVKGQPTLVRSVPLDSPPAEEPSRTIDDLSLQKLGLARTLHLTIAVRTSGVRLEHALLLPGAVPLK